MMNGSPHINFTEFSLDGLKVKGMINDSHKWIDYLLNSNSHALYIIDYQKKKIIHQKGISELLGYEFGEFEFDEALSLIHPNDRGIICGLIRSTLFDNDSSLKINASCRLHLSYRIRRKNGSYININRLSGVYEVSSEGYLISTFSLLSPSNSDEQGQIAYKWFPDSESFFFQKRKSIYNESNLTPRELEVLKLLSKGYDYSYISNRLHIAPETIRSHKKKMLRKLGFTSSNELINYFHNQCARF